MRVHTMLIASVLGLASFVHSLPIHESTQANWGVYQLADSIESAPSGWDYRGPAESESLVNLHLVVRSQDGQDLGAKLTKISTPGHAEYGIHLTQQELAAFVSPEHKTVDLITSWLSSFSGVSDIEYLAYSSTISFTTTVSAAADMLGTEFGIYQATKDTTTIARSLEYSLPERLFEHVSIIHPITYFPTIKERVAATQTSEKVHTRSQEKSLSHILPRDWSTDLLAACSSITPNCIAKMYNITYTPPTNVTASGSRLGVAGFIGQWINHTDITSFITKYAPSNITKAHPGKFTVELVNNGTNNEALAGVEATLDLEYSMPFTGNLPVVYYSVGGHPPVLGPDGQELPLNQSHSEPYLEWLQYMLAKPDGELPQVVSISYTDTEQTVPRDYATHVCNLFGRLAMRGVSIIDASGDGGVAGQEDVDCISNDGEKRPTFLPTFPASCPWVTSVGSTSVIPAQGSSFSSGGFSNYFPVPDYQVNSTSAYIKTLNGQYTGLYNASGRGIPDIAIHGSHYETENNGVSSGQHSGTSAGTPVFAAMIALVNDIRLRKGKPVLGWLNPLLYSEDMRSAFDDITEGTSYGCGEMWNATTGWDTVTGLGSPAFEKLVAKLG